MCVAWIDGTTRAIRTLDERNLGWPNTSIPTRSPPGRGCDSAFLPHRRRLPPPQPPRRSTLRVHKAPLGLRDHHPRPLAAASGRGERTLVLAGCSAVLL